ncbi:hypothetical protein H8356DRAFT_1696936 [Neocallimastix lanati (nom. inval.)]|nr:hypothetical protein H8356DRAFT_1696936 [Neocallimastix sp. JGI-2020a]
MYFSPTYIFYNKINKFMKVYFLPCLYIYIKHPKLYYYIIYFNVLFCYLHYYYGYSLCFDFK